MSSNKVIHNLKKYLPTILKVILALITIAYIGFYFYATIFSRTPKADYDFKPQPFWSYVEWFGGNKEIGTQILKNLVVLIPVGFLITAILYGTRWKEKNKFLLVLGISIFISVISEAAQLIFRLGTCEFDDVLNNTIGGCAGYGLYRLFQNSLDAIRHKWKGSLPRRRVLSGWLCILIGLLCLLNVADIENKDNKTEIPDQASYIESDVEKNVEININNQVKNHPVSIERSDNRLMMEDAKKWDFVFQLDSVNEIDDELVLKGFTFVLRQDSEYYKKFKPAILLRTDENSEWFVLNTEYGQEREDVNQYFLCEYDYSKTGFTAKASVSDLDLDQEYEVLIRFGGLGVSETNTFFTGTDIHYASEESFKAPETDFTDLDTIVKEGKLRLYKPDKYCWIYQYEGDLYWILEDGFLFGINEYTHMPYELHTTQENNLPENTKVGDFDNPDVLFERDEITNDMDCGLYRVMKKELPIEYSISCVRTGLWIRSSNEWVWQSHLWPYYDFSKENSLF